MPKACSYQHSFFLQKPLSASEADNITMLNLSEKSSTIMYFFCTAAIKVAHLLRQLSAMELHSRVSLFHFPLYQILSGAITPGNSCNDTGEKHNSLTCAFKISLPGLQHLEPIWHEVMTISNKYEWGNLPIPSSVNIIQAVCPSVRLSDIQSSHTQKQTIATGYLMSRL